MTPGSIDTTVPPSAEGCQAPREVLARVGDKWSVQIVLTLDAGPHRFNQLRRGIPGISQRMLTLTLRGLERDGLVERTSFDTVPPRVDYALTALGRSLAEPVRRLGAWAQANHTHIRAARTDFDERGGAARRSDPATLASASA
ncbi:helix-turn-helix domain-containing protein [Lichenihabitans sp. Uapishka_5]|uniref:winged helix-turn-helix transcriptional regulator n=1 Tax=Lichenihabitans sp. Uapishka_5 TaxID=3037302 RepID=UPI0029E7FCBC|nr:helix-turn-helix domain-containing protein [Lichenihabitans sp. Uapishka_5]MDX7951025.1 helix-turn-helix domain-containing protein [Lichenihabitans sp. Uapishka_5]